jgi:hydroxymethylpyrimidine kinase/phosphomethylpyrimidine kinase/thiamine-phosphate diphosphorylase
MVAAWTIAGTDPSGGAGIASDLATFRDFGVRGGAIVAAVIAQNSRSVRAVRAVGPDLLRAQWDALREEGPPDAIKIGVLGDAETARAAAALLRDSDARVVCDPVLASSGGAVFLDDIGRRVLLDEILPRVTLFAPNIPEAEALSGSPIRGPGDREAAGREFLRRGALAVAIKGGHAEGPYRQDLVMTADERHWLTSPCLDTPHTHGTGCAFSSAAAAAIARGYDLDDAVVLAKTYVNQGLRLGGAAGAAGRGSPAHAGWPSNPADLPWRVSAAAGGGDRFEFPRLEPFTARLWAVADNEAWLRQLVDAGVGLIQLRPAPGSMSAADLRRCMAYAWGRGSLVLLCDDWRAAVAAGVTGALMGAAEVDDAAARALSAAGLCLVLTVSSLADLARAAAWRPTAVVAGPVLSASGEVGAIGLDRFRVLRALSAAPVVAAGGITGERAGDVFAAGADGVALSSDLLRAPDPVARAKEWLAALARLG